VINRVKKKLIILLSLCVTVSMPALASETPNIAVYVTGGVNEDVNKALSTFILNALIRSGGYVAIERSDDFIEQLNRELIKQRSGAVDDREIRRLGMQAGVQFVCVADITRALGTYQISARIIDVETARVLGIGVARSDMASMGVMERVSEEIVLKMLNPEAAKAAADAANRVGLRPFIPGWAQIHKGSNIKGTLFIVGGTALTGGAIVTEMLRAENVSKVNSTFDAAQRRSYEDRANTMQNVCVGLIVGAAGLYLWNIVDGFAAKRSDNGRYAQAHEPDFRITPYVNSRSGAGGLTLTLNF
jgi:hypothetical protein